ncbi:MAG: hypothetical protein ACI8W8_003229 [Rhodothermales bacterium]|jgi:hypothetical protein
MMITGNSLGSVWKRGAAAFGAIIVLLCSQSHLSAQTASTAWKAIDTNSLEDWSDPSTVWHSEEGVIYADSKGSDTASKVSYLMWDGAIKGSYELVLEYRMIAKEPQDAGIYFGAERPSAEKLKQMGKDGENILGLQAELDTCNMHSDKWWAKQGKFYGHIHDGKRSRMYKRDTKLTISANGSMSKEKLPKRFLAPKAFKEPPAWNAVRILVEGDRTRLYLNGQLANDITDLDINGRPNGDAVVLQFRPQRPYRFAVKAMKYRQLRASR